jgi:hypothetical protein
MAVDMTDSVCEHFNQGQESKRTRLPTISFRVSLFRFLTFPFPFPFHDPAQLGGNPQKEKKKKKGRKEKMGGAKLKEVKPTMSSSFLILSPDSRVYR